MLLDRHTSVVGYMVIVIEKDILKFFVSRMTKNDAKAENLYMEHEPILSLLEGSSILVLSSNTKKIALNEYKPTSSNKGEQQNFNSWGKPRDNMRSVVTRERKTHRKYEKPTEGGESDSPSIIAKGQPIISSDPLQTVEYVGFSNNVDTSSIPIVEATLINDAQIESNEVNATEYIGSRTVKLGFLLSIISIIVATAAILIVLNVGNDGNDGNDSTNEDNTLPPTHSPTRSNTDAITNILFQNGVISVEDLENVTSPHNKALQWLGSVDEMPLDGDDHIIQRYCLALLYYSTSGDDWKSKGDWLQNKHECEWNFFIGNMVAGVRKCNTRMKVTEIDLGYNNLYGV